MATSSPPPHAGVHVPPPLLYVAGFLLGWLLHRWWPAPITAGPSTGRMLAAAACVAVYLVIFAAAFLTFRRARTTLIPNRPATRLATGGPYRLTRNPMYVSLAALYLGVALFANSWWPVALLPLVLLVVDRAVIAREERYLAAAFPDEYAAYRARVRRWL
jgi:protein-S-isoprenylcysteine O-methyltransferase Ste14